jgi:hypothetical protein
MVNPKPTKITKTANPAPRTGKSGVRTKTQKIAERQKRNVT